MFPLLALAGGAAGTAGAAAGAAGAGMLAAGAAPTAAGVASGIMGAAPAAAKGGWGELLEGLMGGGGGAGGGGGGGGGIEPPKLPGPAGGIMGPAQRGPQGAPQIPGMGQQAQMPGPSPLPGPQAPPPINQQSSGPSLGGLMAMQNQQGQQQPFQQKEYSEPKMNEYLRGLLYGNSN